MVEILWGCVRFSIKIGFHSNAAGSAYVEQGQTKVFCSVCVHYLSIVCLLLFELLFRFFSIFRYGPRSQSAIGQSAERCKLLCFFKFAPFAQTQRRPMDSQVLYLFLPFFRLIDHQIVLRFTCQLYLWSNLSAIIPAFSFCFLHAFFRMSLFLLQDNDERELPLFFVRPLNPVCCSSSTPSPPSNSTSPCWKMMEVREKWKKILVLLNRSSRGRRKSFGPIHDSPFCFHLPLLSSLYLLLLLMLLVMDMLFICFIDVLFSRSRWCRHSTLTVALSLFLLPVQSASSCPLFPLTVSSAPRAAADDDDRHVVYLHR